MWPFKKTKSIQDLMLEAEELNKKRDELLKEISDRATRTFYTPDLPTIYDRLTQPVLMYGTTQIGLPDWHLVKDEIWGAVAFTVDSFGNWKYGSGQSSFPVAMDQNFDNHPFVPVKGELMLVRASKLIELDYFYKNGVKFERRPVQVLIPFPNKETGLLTAWMYVGKEDYFGINDMEYSEVTVYTNRYQIPADVMDRYSYFNPVELYQDTYDQERAIKSGGKARIVPSVS